MESLEAKGQRAFESRIFRKFPQDGARPGKFPITVLQALRYASRAPQGDYFRIANTSGTKREHRTVLR
jgi:hypothetical protein